jgi:hypothetical protein
MRDYFIIELEKAKAMLSIVNHVLAYSDLPDDLVTDYLKLNEQYNNDIQYLLKQIEKIEL